MGEAAAGATATRGVTGFCTAPNRCGQNLGRAQTTQPLCGEAPRPSPWLRADRMSSNQSLRESFSRWYYTFCSHGAGIQGDLSGQSSFRHSEPVAYKCNWRVLFERHLSPWKWHVPLLRLDPVGGRSYGFHWRCQSISSHLRLFPRVMWNTPECLYQRALEDNYTLTATSQCNKLFARIINNQAFLPAKDIWGQTVNIIS